jgi:hypothetical protein
MDFSSKETRFEDLPPSSSVFVVVVVMAVVVLVIGFVVVVVLVVELFLYRETIFRKVWSLVNADDGVQFGS